MDISQELIDRILKAGVPAGEFKYIDSSPVDIVGVKKSIIPFRKVKQVKKKTTPHFMIEYYGVFNPQSKKKDGFFDLMIAALRSVEFEEFDLKLESIAKNSIRSIKYPDGMVELKFNFSIKILEKRREVKKDNMRHENTINFFEIKPKQKKKEKRKRR